VTIGVYGFERATFFQALRDAGVDTFCDVRARRGVRGSFYTFANSSRLQQRLLELDINYHHCKALAPSPLLRQTQKLGDKARKVAKRKRVALEPGFAQAYEQECLAPLDAQQFLTQMGAQARVICLFCVEREPAACHRSLLAAKLSQELGLEVIHLVP
jgi:uncharacterized protein (DUF488 family)